jgi:hypothetical protein
LQDTEKPKKAKKRVLRRLLRYYENMTFETNRPPQPPFTQFRLKPWQGRGRDDEARLWRDLHSDFIQACNEKDEYEGQTAGKPTRRIQLTTLYESEASIYISQADPEDRRSLLAWIGERCVASDQLTNGNGLAMVHIMAGRLMKIWADRAWTGIDQPEWAQDVFRDLHKTGFNHDKRLTEQVALEDLGIFLEAHEHAVSLGAQGRLRNVAYDWNRDATNACCCLIILASEAPDRVPEKLAQSVLKFQACFEENTLHQDTRRRALSGWEKRVLTEFTAQVPDGLIPGGEDQTTQLRSPRIL